MTVEEMRFQGERWMNTGNPDAVKMRDHWLIAAEICERLDRLLAEREREGEGEDGQ